MAEQSQRSDYRVEVPADLLREVAVWFSHAPEGSRLPATALGRPHLRHSMLGPARMALTDLSVRGLGMRLTLPARMLEKIAALKHMFAFLQLWDPSADDPHGLLTVFVSCLIRRAALQGESLLLGATFTRFAVGSRHEKTLEFLDAERFGVSELAGWCDKVSRNMTYQGDPDFAGLDLENLLAEVEERPAPTCPEEKA